MCESFRGCAAHFNDWEVKRKRRFDSHLCSPDMFIFIVTEMKKAIVNRESVSSSNRRLVHWKLTLFHRPRKSIEKFLFHFIPKWKNRPGTQQAARETGEREEWRERKLRNKTKYFAFVSHICLLLCSSCRRGTSNSFDEQLHQTAPSVRLSVVRLKQRLIKWKKIALREASRLMIMSSFYVSLRSMIAPFSLMFFRWRCRLHFKDRILPKRLQKLRRNHARLYDRSFFQIGNCRCLHKLTNSCRLILLVQLCWRDEEDVFIGFFVWLEVWLWGDQLCNDRRCL